MTDPEISENVEQIGYPTFPEISTEEWTEFLFQILFEMEKKYSKYLKRKEIVGVEESESDRERIADAYLYLKDIKENLIDSELYTDFIDMSDLREKSFLDKLLHPEQRLDDFASTVAKLCRSIISFEGNTRIKKEKVTIYLEDETLTFDSVEKIKEFIHSNRAFFIQFQSLPITRMEEMSLEQKLISKLKNQRLKKNELNSYLTSFEAEILSKLISEKKIVVIQDNEYLCFEEIFEEEKGISSSYLLSPSKNKK